VLRAGYIARPSAVAARSYERTVGRGTQWFKHHIGVDESQRSFVIAAVHGIYKELCRLRILL
jgi:hypothetical protein